MNKTLLAALLLVNFEAIAGTEEEYWSAWRVESEHIAQCRDPNRLSKFMNQALENAGNAERFEANAQVIEGIIMSSPSCFRKGADLLDARKCRALFSLYVEAPTFSQPSEIQQSLAQAYGPAAYCRPANQR